MPDQEQYKGGPIDWYVTVRHGEAFAGLALEVSSQHARIYPIHNEKRTLAVQRNEQNPWISKLDAAVPRFFLITVLLS